MMRTKPYINRYDGYLVIDLKGLSMAQVKKKVAAYKTLYEESNIVMKLDGNFLDVTLDKVYGGRDVKITPDYDINQNVKLGNKYFTIDYRVERGNHKGKLITDTGRYGYAQLLIEVTDY